MKVTTTFITNQDEINHIVNGNESGWHNLPVPTPIIKEVEVFIKEPHIDIRYYWVIPPSIVNKESQIYIGLGGFDGRERLVCKYTPELESMLKQICKD